MASLVAAKNKNGTVIRYDLFWYSQGGRKVLALSPKQFDETDALQAKKILELVLEYESREEDLPPRLNDKLNALPIFKKKLIEKGVLKCDKETTLKELWNLFYASPEFKSFSLRTQENYDLSKRRSLLFFGENVIVDSIELADAKKFSAWLDSSGNFKTGLGVSIATRAGTIKNIKTLFNWGSERDYIKVDNPFLKLKRGSFVNRERLDYVSEEDAIRMLNACLSQEWRVLIALARWGGIRIPSEIVDLRWKDVDFDLDCGFITVKDKKRKQDRTFPLFPQIRKELERLKEQRGFVRDNELIIQGRDETSNLRTTLIKIRERAGVQNYGKPWQNLRASAATDICAKFGSICESEWVGHSEAVSMRHYLQTRKSDFIAANKE